MNFKSKFSLFNKSNAHKSIDIEILPKETINQNASWFQSMEPINYAKNQTKKLYEIDNININARFQWRFQPLSDMFLVYTDNYYAENPLFMNLKSRSFAFKLNYWINI